MKTNYSSKIYYFSLATALALSLSACKTTPMYTEGDIHFEATCIEGDVTVCQAHLEAACAEYDGEVVEVDIRRERYISEELRNELRALGRQARSVHLTCRPPAEPDETVE